MNYDTVTPFRLVTCGLCVLVYNSIILYIYRPILATGACMSFQTLNRGSEGGGGAGDPNTHTVTQKLTLKQTHLDRCTQ